MTTARQPDSCTMCACDEKVERIRSWYCTALLSAIWQVYSISAARPRIGENHTPYLPPPPHRPLFLGIVLALEFLFSILVCLDFLVASSEFLLRRWLSYHFIEDAFSALLSSPPLSLNTDRILVLLAVSDVSMPRHDFLCVLPAAKLHVGMYRLL